MSPDVLTDIAVEELQSAAALEALQPEWAALWSRCPSATPFQHPAWLLPWWRHFGSTQLMGLALRQEDKLVGLAPLFIWHRSDTHERTVLLMGTGITDYTDALFEPGAEEDGMAAVFDYLETERHRWDVCQLEQLREDSPLRVAPAPLGWKDEVEVQDVCPELRWREGVHGLDEMVPPGALKKLRYYNRRTERQGHVEVEQATGATFEASFDILLRLHGSRWASKGKGGVLAGHPVRSFHRDAARRLLRTGILRLYVMRVNGKPVAAYYGMLAHGRAYYYLSGFDPAYIAPNLGTQIVGHAIEQAMAEGATAFDFLRGREDYKYTWGATDRLNYKRRLFHG